MKVGILTLFHGNRNWGGVLQGYALKTYIESRFEDAKADILIYHSERNLVYPNLKSQIKQYTISELFKKTKTKLFNKVPAAVGESLVGRNRLFDEFMHQFETNPTVYTDETLIDSARDYDFLISGSDQIWNPNVSRPGFFQSMIGNECTKISYAASIARDSLSQYELSVMVPLIKKFDAVSVREKTAKEILSPYFDRDIIVEVLDPAMMLHADEWRRLAAPIPRDSGRYALAFFFSDSFVYRSEIEDYCRTHNLTLRFIPFASQYIPSDKRGYGDKIYDVGPREFISLFDHAECVFTDSFHSSVFSIIFGKNFCVFERDKKTKVSKNSRLYDLLEKFDLSQRMVDESTTIESVMDKSIDYSAVDARLNECRCYSHAFLEKALRQNTTPNS